jgi:hypothetical protein
MSDPEPIGTIVKRLLGEMQAARAQAGGQTPRLELWDEAPGRRAEPSGAGVPACGPLF